MKNPKKLIIVSALISLFLFLAIMFNLASFSSADLFFNSLSSSIKAPTLIQVSKIISLLFEPAYIIILSLILSVFMWTRGARKDSAFFSILMITGGIAMYSFKEIVQRARPLNSIVSEASFSFPSGHALISLIFFGFLIYLAMKNIKSNKIKTIISAILIVIVFLVGISRIILNVHWFSDVMAGFLFGLFLLFSGLAIKRR